MPNAISSESTYAGAIFKGLQAEPREVAGSEFDGCQFLDCNLTEAVLRDCRLSDCTFIRCDLSLVEVPGSTFVGIRFEESTLVGVNWARADWSTLNLGRPLDFQRCALSHSTFISTPLGAVAFIDCVAKNVDFREADLTGAAFTGTDLTEALFSHTILRDADLSAASNYVISPEDNVLTGAKFSLPEAMALLYSMDIELVQTEDESDRSS